MDGLLKAALLHIVSALLQFPKGGAFMSEYIELEGGKRIREWQEANPPATIEEKRIVGV